MCCLNAVNNKVIPHFTGKSQKHSSNLLYIQCKSAVLWLIRTARDRDRDRDGNNGFLYYTMYCTHYAGTETRNHCFLSCTFWSLSRSREVCLSHYCYALLGVRGEETFGTFMISRLTL